MAQTGDNHADFQTRMPKDDNGNAIPALSLARDGGAHNLSVPANGMGTVQNTTRFRRETRVASLYLTVPCYIKFGFDASVRATSSDHYFPEGVYYDFAIGGKGGPASMDEVQNYGYISVLAVSSSGNAYLSEKI